MPVSRELFAVHEPPPGGVQRLRATLRARVRHRRQRRLAAATAVVAAVALRVGLTPSPPPLEPVPPGFAFDRGDHPALAVVKRSAPLPLVSLRDDSGALRRVMTRRDDVLFYELIR